jgi:DNA-binding Xre family transcriptional regulator
MQLAEQAGINKNTATALWHGRPTRVDLPTLERLCKALECRLEDILEQSEEERLAARVAGRQTNTTRAAEVEPTGAAGTVPVASVLF